MKRNLKDLNKEEFSDLIKKAFYIKGLYCWQKEYIFEECSFDINKMPIGSGKSFAKTLKFILTSDYNIIKDEIDEHCSIYNTYINTYYFLSKYIEKNRLNIIMPIELEESYFKKYEKLESDSKSNDFDAIIYTGGITEDDSDNWKDSSDFALIKDYSIIDYFSFYVSKETRLNGKYGCPTYCINICCKNDTNFHKTFSKKENALSYLEELRKLVNKAI